MNNFSSIRAHLTRTGQVIRFSELLSGTVRWLTLSLGLWLVLFIVDNLLNLPAAVRFPLALAAGGFLLAGLVRRVVRPMFQKVNAEKIAVVLEQKQGVRNNLLINACQLEVQTLSPAEKLFAEKTVEDSAAILSSLPLRSLWKRQYLLKWGAALLLLAAMWLTYGLAFPRFTVNALMRYVIPLSDIPPAGSTILTITPATDMIVSEGADLTVTAWVANPNLQKVTPKLAPVIIWKEGHQPVAPLRNLHSTATMLDDSGSGQFRYVFRSIQRSFSFRVLDQDTYSRSIQVTVQPKPKVISSRFRITPPSYTGLPRQEMAGPPAAVSCLPTSTLEVQMSFDQPLETVTWNFAKVPLGFKKSGEVWTTFTRLTNAGPYSIEIMSSRNSLPIPLTSGEIQLETDSPPEIHFVTDNSNLFVVPGTKLALTLQAADDYGMSNIVVTCRPGDDLATNNEFKVIKQWTYSGPPGNKGPVRESFVLDIDPSNFSLGETYLLEALSWDFRPGTKPGRSKPIVLRVKGLADLSLPPGDVLTEAMILLKQTIAAQKKANDSTDNLSTHLEEAVQSKDLNTHCNRMQKFQEETRAIGRQSIAAFLKYPTEGHSFSERLTFLVENEMELAIQQIGGIKEDQNPAQKALLPKLTHRQTYILNELIALMGLITNERNQKNAGRSSDKTPSLAPALHDEKAATLSDDIKDFERAQKQIIKTSKDLLDKRPEDLTRDEKEEILGELARTEAEWAKFLEEKLTDFSKLPLQDFSDASVAKQLNEVIQDIDKAAEALYKKKVEMAVPLEQSGLEKAEELVNNLEKWLSNKPDKIKWSMEEPANPEDIPLAELPAELEDIVGELLDKEDEMQDDVEDVSSSWLDSIDKGAGWDAADGPISSMSAKGVTGNLLPNQQEIGGRSGEGRSGRSQGQMVQDSAEGKGGRPTPTRLSPSPFEPGSVKDSSKEGTGGATGGGRLSGFSEPGLHGPTPPPPEKMARIAGSQAKIRQEAEALALKLRKYKLPSGDIETAIAFMKKMEEAARLQNGLGVRRSYNSAIDSLVESRKEIRAELGVHREQTRLPNSTMREIMTGFKEGTPKGYEELVSAYFRRMAGETQ